MAIVRRIIAASIAAGVLAAGVGVAQTAAAAVVKPANTVVVNGGGQGNWPLAR